MKDPHRYDKIIDLPRFVSKNRKHMSNYDRAAQFAPFDALTGYDEAIEETGRTTENEVFLSESELEDLDMRFRIIAENITRRPEVLISYFIKDLYKDGGSYVDELIRVKRIDLVARVLISEENKRYDLDYIVRVDGQLIDEYMNI
ncbi:MAG: hypothetical protein IKI61_01200 [Erysipelotrichaceae bacterium]|nr:hypothetical protein [Erysipelotrichaceae bacterium]